MLTRSPAPLTCIHRATSGFPIVDANRKEIGFIYPDHQGDAVLFANAPELLATARKCLAYLQNPQTHVVSELIVELQQQICDIEHG